MHRRTVVALPETPVEAATILVQIYLHSHTREGALWVWKNTSVPHLLTTLGLTETCGEWGEKCWILHNGEELQGSNIKLDDGDVIMLWKLEIGESPRTVPCFTSGCAQKFALRR